MQSSTMQERMAANKRQKNLAQQAAEMALREGESYINNQLKSADDLVSFLKESNKNEKSNNLYSAVNIGPGEGAFPQPELSKPEQWLTVPDIENFRGVGNPPKYVIEYLGRDRGGGGQRAQEIGYVDTVDTDPYVFRITAIGWGKDENIYAILKSTYRTGYGEDSIIY